jgi:hypothetical protein
MATARAHGGGKQIADEGGRRRRAGRLADADAEPRGDQSREAARKAGRRPQQAPHEHAGRKNLPALDLVGQSSERQSDHGIQQREDRAEEAERGIAEPHLTPDAFADAADDLTVEEVHQVDGEQHRERVAGTRHRLPPRIADCGLRIADRGSRIADREGRVGSASAFRIPRSAIRSSTLRAGICRLR